MHNGTDVCIVSITEAMRAVRTLLTYLGENVEREGLRDTPARVVKALTEMTSGTHEDPRRHLQKSFALDDDESTIVGAYDQIVLSRDLPFSSLCEHHMLPFTGTAHIAYLPDPNGRVVGLSKLARLLDGYARRLQVQERLTQQIADALQSELNPLGVGVVIKARHTCQCLRGIKKDGLMVTSAMYGAFKEDASARSELMRLIML